MKTVTILGGGFGGVYTARRLLRRGFRVRLISRDDFFTFTPLLHEVATATLRREDVTFPFKTFFRSPRFELIKGEVTGLDMTRRIITLADSRTFEYETLVLATGAHTYAGGIEDTEKALALKTIEDALAIRSALEAGAAAETFRVGIVGAGPTGVELACEIKQLLRRKGRCRAEVRLFSSYGLPFESHHPRIASYIAWALERLGVTFHGRFIVDRLEAGAVHGHGTSYPLDLIILTPGIRPNTAYADPSLRDGFGNIEVDENLRVKGLSGVFALGDIITLPKGKPQPLAQLAVQQAGIVANNIIREAKGTLLTRYRVRLAGILVSLGKWDAVGVVFGRLISGRIAWYIWRTVYLFKTPSFLNKLRIAYRWTIYLVDSRRFFRPRPERPEASQAD